MVKMNIFNAVRHEVPRISMNNREAVVLCATRREAR